VKIRINHEIVDAKGADMSREEVLAITHGKIDPARVYTVRVGAIDLEPGERFPLSFGLQVIAFVDVDSVADLHSELELGGKE
jgi:hypothetical protein